MDRKALIIIDDSGFDNDFKNKEIKNIVLNGRHDNMMWHTPEPQPLLCLCGKRINNGEFIGVPIHTAERCRTFQELRKNVEWVFVHSCAHCKVQKGLVKCEENGKFYCSETCQQKDQH